MCSNYNVLQNKKNIVYFCTMLTFRDRLLYPWQKWREALWRACDLHPLPVRLRSVTACDMRAARVGRRKPAVRAKHSEAGTRARFGLDGLASAPLTVCGLLEVHIGVTQRSPGDHVATHTDGQHRSRRAEFLVQHCLRDVGVQVAHIQGSHGVTACCGCIHNSQGTADRAAYSRAPGASVQSGVKPSAESGRSSETGMLRRPAGPRLSFSFKYLLLSVIKRQACGARGLLLSLRKKKKKIFQSFFFYLFFSAQCSST